jgi:CHAD domain-containing protein
MGRKLVRRRDLDRRAGPVVARVASRLLEDARQAFAQMEAGEGPEDLHDFRVAIRRLLSTVEQFSSALEERRSVRAIRALRRLHHASSEARDFEVQVAWILAQAEDPEGVPSQALLPLLRELEEAKQAGYERVGRQIPDLLAKAEASLARLLVRVKGPKRKPARSGHSRFGTRAARQIELAAHELERRLDRITGLHQERRMHRARIATKTLRFLLEMAAGHDPVALAMAADLRNLQGVLGELNDLRVLRTTLTQQIESAALARARARLGAVRVANETAMRRATRRNEELPLLALDRRIEERRQTLYASLEATWLADAPASPLGRLPEITAALRTPENRPRSARAAPAPAPVIALRRSATPRRH